RYARSFSFAVGAPPRPTVGHDCATHGHSHLPSGPPPRPTVGHDCATHGHSHLPSGPPPRPRGGHGCATRGHSYLASVGARTRRWAMTALRTVILICRRGAFAPDGRP